VADFEELFNSGGKAYREGRDTDALGLYRLAMQVAVEQGNAVAEHECLFWIGHCRESLGEIGRAVGSYLDMRLLEHRRPDLSFSDVEVWAGRKRTFECMLANPQPLPLLEERLKELETFALVHPVPSHDLYVLRGNLAMERGLWREALEQFESGNSIQESRRGYSALGFAASAATASLRIGKFGAARDWISAMRSPFAEFAEELVRLAQGIAMVELARAQADIDELHKQLVSIASLPIGVDNLRHQHRLAQFWGSLFDRAAGDPAMRDHPARRILARSPATRDNLTTLFEYALAVLDYRVASLRFAVGLPSWDDQWHVAEPPRALELVDWRGIERRLARARTAAQGVMRRAAYLDRAFECDWRQADVAKRIRAIEAISAAFAEGDG
jgi:hypothetical protein